MDTPTPSVNVSTKPWQLYLISLDYAVAAMAMGYGEAMVRTTTNYYNSN
jgi:hypothetical protein